MQNKTLLYVFSLSTLLFSSCTNDLYYAKTPSASGNNSSPTNTSKSEEDKLAQQRGADAVTNTEKDPAIILSSIKGAWSAVCQDGGDKTKNSTKDIVIVYDNAVVIYSLHFKKSRSCEDSKISMEDSKMYPYNFTAVAGDEERNNALAIDLLNKDLLLEGPKNVLLVLASPHKSTKKLRLLFEVFASDLASMRFQIQDWSDKDSVTQEIVPKFMSDAEKMIFDIERLAKQNNDTHRSIYYTNSQTLSKSSKSDIEFAKKIEAAKKATETEEDYGD